MQREKILVAFSAGAPVALGNVWRITAKATDFYLDPLDQDDVIHLSVHGPSSRHPGGHRFHVKVDHKAAATAHERGRFAAHQIPRKGHTFNGKEVAPGAFLVARVRWTWDMQRERYRQAAFSGPLPDVGTSQFRRIMSKPLGINEAADLDVVISHGAPYWPGGERSARDNARLGPLRNGAGMTLTATFVRRLQRDHPVPEGLEVPRPRAGDEPNRIMGGGPDPGGTEDPYWFVETITSRQVSRHPRKPGQSADRAVERVTRAYGPGPAAPLCIARVRNCREGRSVGHLVLRRAHRVIMRRRAPPPDLERR